ncbi:MAG: DinB family protein [Actinobacteria bacterium]|nr:DinB family protein [Actinomycetota bacterium]
MSSYLKRLVEYNNWANLRIIEACSGLTDEQLDVEASTSTKGSIRVTLWHLLAAQQRYVWRATGEEPRFNWQAPPPFDELREASAISGEQLLKLAGSEPQATVKTQYEGIDYDVESWVVMVQAIYHGGEHREQIKSMLTVLGITPPEIDGWMFGEVTGALRERTANKS